MIRFTFIIKISPIEERREMRHSSISPEFALYLRKANLNIGPLIPYIEPQDTFGHFLDCEKIYVLLVGNKMYVY